MASLVVESGVPKIVTVFHGDDLEKVEISMKLQDTTRTVYRPKDEQLAPSLERIKTNFRNANAKLQKKANKSLKKANKHEEAKNLVEFIPTVELYNTQGDKIGDETMIVDAWQQARTLKVCELSYHVICNPPRVESLKLLASPLVGMPIHPQIQLKKASLDYSKFLWYKCLPVAEEEMDTEISNNSATPSSKRPKLSTSSEMLNREDKEWILVGSEKTYSATKDDIGYALKLTVLPGNEKYSHDCGETDHSDYIEELSAITEGVVQAGPEKCIFDQRQMHTRERCKGKNFRFVTYNILAEVYSKTDYAQDFLFPYCPAEYIHIGYRQQLVVKELIGYNADIICLQEVDRFVFESQLMPAMSIEGYAGAFALKDGIKEGEALFYRRDRFRLQSVDNIILRKALKEERNEDLYLKIAENQDFLKNIQHRPTCVLAAILQSIDDPSRHILLGNTHLYWHPRGCGMRVVQVEIILRELKRMRENFLNEHGISDIATIVTGDLNSHPHSAVVQLLTEGSVPSNHSDWFSMGKTEYIRNMQVRNPIKFESACGYPKYTNFVTGFIGCLDYVFIDPSRMSVEKVIPQPSHDDVIEHSALPSMTSPSDHIAQVVDLSWKEIDVPMRNAPS